MLYSLSGDSRQELQRIIEISGQNIYACYQCVMCTATCTPAEDMDIPPNLIVRMLQLGVVDKPLNSRAIWICTSCYSCQAECPKGIDIASLTEALRLMHIRRNIDHVSLSEGPGDLPVIALVSISRKYTA